MKLNLADIKSNITQRAGESFGDKFSNLYQTYSNKSKLLKDIQNVIGKVGVKPNGIKLNPTQTQTAISRLQRVFAENGTEYLDTIRQLEDEVGVNILDKVAASQLAQKLPKTLRTAPIGMGGTINDFIALLTLPISSPRFSAFLISQIGGYGRGTVTKLLNANPKIREAIHDAVVNKNMKFSDAVELYARDFIQNPKMGLSIEDVSKKAGTVADDLTSSIQKAKASGQSFDEWVKGQITESPDYAKGEGSGHTAPFRDDYNAPAHELTKIYPDDVYEKGAQYYGSGYKELDNEAMSILRKVKDNPDAEITIYRAVPKGQGIKEINPGDWITLTKGYAKEHGISNLNGKYEILSKKVKADEVFTDANSLQEFGYDPRRLTRSQLKAEWDKVNPK